MSAHNPLPHKTSRARRVLCVAVAAAASFAAPGAIAKTSGPVGVSLKPNKATPTSAAPTTTTLPAPRSAGTPIKNWSSVTADDWPEPGNAIVIHPRGRSVEVHRAPDEDVGKLRFDNGGATYGRVTFLLLEDEGDWLRVALPMRPNGTAGWVRSSEVITEHIRERILIELDSNTLTLERDGRAVLVERIAAGTGGTPTPRGLFYVKEIVPQGNPNGALGPFALGLSGYSEVLYSFAGGNGVIGIHGTNAPGKLGSDVSHGCIRTSNSVIASLARTIPLGTPVEIANRRADVPQRRHTSAPADAQAPTSADPPTPGTPAAAEPTPDPTTPGSTAPTTTTSVPVPPTAPPTGAPLPLGTLPNPAGPPH